MKKICLCLLLLPLLACQTTKVQKPVLVTSIAPFASLLEQVVGEHFQVVNIAGNTATAEDMDLSLYNTEQLTQAELYFSFFLPFEQVLEQKKLLSPKKIVRLDQVVDSMTFGEAAEQWGIDHYPNTGEGHHHSTHQIDPHIWTSPKQMLHILDVSYRKILLLDPLYQKEYQEKFVQVQKILEELNQDLKDSVAQMQNKEFLVFHPAFGYLARDYGLKQLAIEEEGKETSLKEMEKVVDWIRSKNIKLLFLQQEFPESLVQGLKKVTGISIIQVNPLSPDYVQQTNLFIDALKRG